MLEPKMEEVGCLLQMMCGHNGQPVDLEATLLTIHLDLAGFVTSKNDGTTTIFVPSPSFAPRITTEEPEPKKEEQPLQVIEEEEAKVE